MALVKEIFSASAMQIFFEIQIFLHSNQNIFRIYNTNSFRICNTNYSFRTKNIFACKIFFSGGRQALHLGSKYETINFYNFNSLGVKNWRPYLCCEASSLIHVCQFLSDLSWLVSVNTGTVRDWQALDSADIQWLRSWMFLV